MFDVDNFRPFLCVFQMPTRPLLLDNFRIVIDIIAKRDRLWAARDQSRRLEASTVFHVGPIGRSRRCRPNHVAMMCFANILLVLTLQNIQECWLRCIPFVERDPIEADSIGESTLIKLQRDLRLWPVGNLVWDLCLTAPLTII